MTQKLRWADFLGDGSESIDHDYESLRLSTTVAGTAHPFVKTGADHDARLSGRSRSLGFSLLVPRSCSCWNVRPFEHVGVEANVNRHLIKPLA